MADIGIDRPLVADRAEAETRERFLSAPRVAGLALFVVFALTFDVAAIQDDGIAYYDFMRKLFGSGIDAAAYQFGSTFWNAPFYLVSQLAAVIGDSSRNHAGVVGVTVASNTAVLVTLYIGWRILRELDLPRGPAVLLLTVFGTPLWFYAVMRPSYKHAADTLYATAAIFFVLRSLRGDARRRDFIAAGVCYGLLLATRYANAGLLAGTLAVLVVARHRRVAAWTAGAAVATALVLFAIPVVRGIPYKTPPEQIGMAQAVVDSPAMLGAPQQRVALGGVVIIEPVLKNVRFRPLAPVYMLFTLHRGIFLWTPLTAFATAGFVLLLRRERRHRLFLAVVGVSGLGLLLIHAFWGTRWDGGGSFSQRFLTALFPLVLVGAAEFVRLARSAGVALLALCAAFSVWIGFVQVIGYYQESGADSVVQIVENFTGPYRDEPPHNYDDTFQREFRGLVSDRWQQYWRLVT